MSHRKYNPDKATRAVKRAAQMPRLRHSQPGREFDPAHSEVVRWLLAQREILLAMFNHYKDSGAIVFDRATGQWKGCDTP